MQTEQCRSSAGNKQIFNLSNIAKKFFILLSGIVLLSSCSSGSDNSGSPNSSIKTNIQTIGSTSNPIWSRQVGESAVVISYAATIDPFSDDSQFYSYAVGSTTAGMGGLKQNGLTDYFLAGYDDDGDPTGGLIQVGVTGGNTVAKGVSTDNHRNIYVIGFTDKGISGESQTGKTDYFIAKYGSVTNLLWTKQVGVSNGNTYATGIKVNIYNRSIYVSGYTDSNIAGGTQAGKFDYFIARYDYNGNLIWIKQVGTAGGTTEANGISVDIHGNVYVAGFTDKGISGQAQNGLNDYFIAQYDSFGHLNWTKQVGTIGGKAGAYGISADKEDSVSVYVVGGTNKGLSGQGQNGNEDYFIARYDIDGNLIWAQQVGAISGTTQASAVSADGGGDIYVAGRTDRAISHQTQHGSQDAFAARYDKAGNLVDTRQSGNLNSYTEANGISSNSPDVFIAGSATGPGVGQPPQSKKDFTVLYNTNYDSSELISRGAVGSAYGNGISTDKSGNIYVTGYTSVGLSGQTQNGGYDYFIAKYDALSNLIWSKQVGARDGTYGGATEGNGISTDNSGNTYVTGYTSVGISGQTQNGIYDYFVAMYDVSGSLLWTRQVGGPNGQTIGSGISTDKSGNIYVTGHTSVGLSGQQRTAWDYFIAKYDKNGNLIWSRQVGAYDAGYREGYTSGYGISVDESGNNIYVTGLTSVGISGQMQHGRWDYFIARYDSNGKLIWSKQDGGTGGLTQGAGIIVYESGIYITGQTDVGISGQIQNGWNDYFIASYNPSGKLIWSKQVGASGGATEGYGISADESGNIYVTGSTNAGLSGQTQNGKNDYFIATYDIYGKLIRTTQIGAAGGTTEGHGISADNFGNIYVSGWTDISLSGQMQNGYEDYFIAKYAY